MSGPSDIAKAAPDSTTFASQGQVGVIFYALLLVIAWLLIRDFLKDRLIWRIVQANQEADKVTADAIHSFQVTQSRLESALGVWEVKRAVERGELPTGVLK